MRVIQYQRTEWLAEHIYTHTTNRQQNILISTTSGETFHTIYNTNQKYKNKGNNQKRVYPVRFF